ncbi:MAG: elongation factor P [Candidatus Omnitrophica bacterium]|nr:elongation factor P [Candidatus Omnitrophota bacterium]
MITINEVAKGMALMVDGDIWTIVDFNHVKPPKGSAFVRIKLRNLKSSNVIERTYRSAETLEDVPLEERRMQFSYTSGDTYHFMCQETYEEVAISREFLGDKVEYLMDNQEVTGYVFEDKVLKVELPNFIIAKIVEAAPGVKGDSSKTDSKPAKIESGASVMIPLFIEVGETVKIDTRNGQYVERVKQ